jgi:ArsR family transcriptional regulator
MVRPHGHAWEPLPGETAIWVIDRAWHSAYIRDMSKSRSIDAHQLADVFKALSNPHRLKIFLRLTACCGPGTTCSDEREMTACIGELGRDLGIAASTISHHIRELRRAGLVRAERRGQNVACSVDLDSLTALQRFFSWGPHGSLLKEQTEARRA